MHEIHPFEIFVPPNIKHLILGSFTAKDSKKDVVYDWYYSNGRNQFWNIIENVYEVNLPNKDSRQKLFTSLSIGIADIIYECDRVKFNSLDTSLKNITFNIHAIQRVLEENEIQSILFTSRYVESQYKRNFKSQIADFPKVELITLPSPSPRYAKLTKVQKVEIYRKLLPSITKPQ